MYEFDWFYYFVESVTYVGSVDIGSPTWPASLLLFSIISNNHSITSTRYWSVQDRCGPGSVNALYNALFELNAMLSVLGFQRVPV